MPLFGRLFFNSLLLAIAAHANLASLEKDKLPIMPIRFITGFFLYFFLKAFLYIMKKIGFEPTRVT
jgi:hypothetical protein